MKQIITLFFVLSSFIVNAQEDVKYICSDVKGDRRYFLLTNTVKESSFGNGNYLEAWVKEVVYKKVKNKNVMTTEMTKYMVDCQHSRYKILSINIYDSNGRRIDDGNYSEYQDFDHAPPGSIIYLIINAICNN